MFSRKKEGDGKTIETAGWLHEFNLPTFMRVCGKYQVVTGPVLLKGPPVFCRKISRYTVRNLDGGSQPFFVESPLDLPRRFIVVRNKISIVFSYYQYLPINIKGREEEVAYLYAFKDKARILTLA
ncbi:MAG: hypothetical protein AAB497_03565 [Patescibacteria group bacterium]